MTTVADLEPIPLRRGDLVTIDRGDETLFEWRGQVDDIAVLRHPNGNPFAAPAWTVRRHRAIAALPFTEPDPPEAA